MPPGTALAATPAKAVVPSAPALPVVANEVPRAESLLPRSYGTRRLWLSVRDPYSLYAHWDFSEEQLQLYNSFAQAGHLGLRLYLDVAEGEPFREIQLPPLATTVCVEAGRPGAAFVAELGYADQTGHWQRLAMSERAVTPPDRALPVSEVSAVSRPPEAGASMNGGATPELPSHHTDEEAQPTPLPLVVDPDWVLTAFQSPSALEGFPGPAPGAVPGIDSTPASVAGPFASLSSRAAIPAAAAPDDTGTEEHAPAGPMPALSSPAAQVLPPSARSRGRFWLQVNAELVIYGATEPDARLRVAGRLVPLRPDGSFSLRFALPDGARELPILAISASNEDGCAANLRFRRETEYWGASPGPEPA